jgi:uncharacterized protein YndB with AHSA1/START domain
MSTDRIEKSILLRAPLSRVWRAISNSAEFGAWFGMKFDQPFTPGAHMRGTVVPTVANEEVAAKQKSYEGLPVELHIVQMIPESLLSFQWHPFAIESDIDYSAEPMTLVIFELRKVPEGVMLTVTESGFDQIPLYRRAKAFSANENGWGMMVGLVNDYLVQTP